MCFVWGERRGDVVWFVAFERGITFNGTQENGWTPFVVQPKGLQTNLHKFFKKLLKLPTGTEISNETLLFWGDGNLSLQESF